MNEKITVLISDDNNEFATTLANYLEKDEDMQVVGMAKDGEEALSIISTLKPDVVLLDLIMPKMDGLTVMEQVNKQEFVDKRPYFIVLTAVGQEKITEDAFNKGANYYIMKPFNNRMLLERIKFVRKMTHGTERRP